MECTCYIKVLMLIAKHKVNWNVLDHMILDTSLIPVCINLQSEVQSEQRSLPYRDNSFLEYSKTLYTHLLKV